MLHHRTLCVYNVKKRFHILLTGANAKTVKLVKSCGWDMNVLKTKLVLAKCNGCTYIHSVMPVGLYVVSLHFTLVGTQFDYKSTTSFTVNG